MNPVKSTFSFDALQAEIARALPQIPQTEERRKIRQICFQYLEKTCEGLHFKDIHELGQRIKQNKSKIEKSAYQDLLHKIKILSYSSLFGEKFAHLRVLKKLFPERVPSFHKVDNTEFLEVLMKDLLFSKLGREYQVTQTPKLLEDKMKRIIDFFSEKFSFNDEASSFINQAHEVNALLMARCSGKKTHPDLNKRTVSIIPFSNVVKNYVSQCYALLIAPSIDLIPRIQCCFLQRFVGELRPGDSISVSGVMLTQETIGPTPGLTVITATYGHGDGITSGIVPCDQILLLPSGEAIERIAHKSHRIGPTEHSGLGRVRNDPAIHNVCCLSKDVVAQLKEIKAKLENFYPTPVEVEFVVVGSFVHLVKLRPIAECIRAEPYYLHLPQDVKAKVYRGEVLTPGGSFVRMTFDKKDVIIAKDVGKALEMFLQDQRKNKLIHAVLVNHGDVKPYHVLSYFQNELIPVIAFPEALQLIEEQQSFTICPQKGIVVVTNETPIAIKGRYIHPSAAVISLQTPADQSEDKEFLKTLADENVRLEPTSVLIEHLKSPNPFVVRHAVAALLYRLQKFIRDHVQDGSPRLQEKFKVLAMQVLHLGRLAYIHAEKSSMDQLLLVKLIETRMKTALGSSNIVDGEGFDLFVDILKQENQAIEELGPLVKDSQYGGFAFELHKVGRMILNEEVRKRWVAFIRDILSLNDELSIQALVGPIRWLAGFLPRFMNADFPELLQEHASSNKLLRAMLKRVTDMRVHNLWKEHSFLPQVLKSKVGPLVKSLFQLPGVNDKPITDYLLYPWVELGINFPHDVHYCGIDLSYNMKNGDVDLKFLSLAKDEFNTWTNVSTLAYVATHAFKGVSFLNEKSPASKEENVYTFTWSFNLRKAGEHLVGNLQHILMKMLSCCQSTSPSNQSIFSVALECYRLTGKKIGLIDLLTSLPDCILKTYLDDDLNWIKNMGTRCSYEAAFEILNPACIHYLKIERKIMTDKMILGMLTHLLQHQKDDIRTKARKCIEEHFPYEVICSLIDGAYENYSIEQQDFLSANLPIFALINPAIYNRYKPQVIQYFSQLQNITFRSNNSYCFMSIHLNYWTTQECFHFLDLLSQLGRISAHYNIGQIVPYLRSPSMVEKFKEYVNKNRAWVSYMRGLLDSPYVSNNTFSSLLPDQEEVDASCKKELSIFHEMVAGCKPKTVFECLISGSGNIDLVKSLEGLLTKDDVEKNKNQGFYLNTLPVLCNANPRWLSLYQKELLDLIEPSTAENKLFNEDGLPQAVVCMIADILKHADVKTRLHYFKLLVRDKRRMKHIDVPEGITFLQVLLFCKDRTMQQEMVKFLIQEDRWDLMMIGAWTHQGPANELEAEMQILRDQFTPVILRQQWKKIPKVLKWNLIMPCALMGDPRLKETALELVFKVSQEEFNEILFHISSCNEFKDESLDFLNYFGNLQDAEIRSIMDTFDNVHIFVLIKMLSREKNSETLWNRFLPFLKRLPEKMPELSTYVHDRDERLPAEKCEKIMKDLGWKFPAEEDRK